MKMPEMSPRDFYQVNALHAFGLFASSAEMRFERLTRLAKRLFNVPVAFVSLADSHRSWLSSKQDNAGDGRHAFFSEAAVTDKLLVVPDTVLDARFQDHPLIGDASVRFYAGCPIRVGNGDQLGTLCLLDNQPRAFNDDDQALLRDLAKMAEQELFAMELATIDELTRVPNRRGFEAMAEQALNLCKRLDKPVSLFYFDLDLFKQINDRFGHAEGDRALQDFSTILTRSFRQSDIIGRLGGDEFAVLLPNTNQQQAEVALRCLDKTIRQHNRASKRDYKLHYSVGFSDSHTEATQTISDLMQRADARMFENKKAHTQQGAGVLAMLLNLLLPAQRKYRH
ncbi:GGDEF domain-containing protein [Herbaspirillum sp. meg3]|nr:GGDEF domain-containing protein [Herbaspirillum sp. meg3]